MLEPHDGSESRGVEIEGVFYMTYTAYGREYQGVGEPTHIGGVLPMIARSDNLIAWQRLGPIVRGEDNKDHILFPRRIGGRFVALHRRWPRVWLARSDDLRTWREEDMRPIFGPRSRDHWDSKSVGANGVPIETEEGWLLLYHGYDEDHVYKFGVCLLDLEKPHQVVHRSQDPIFWPQELWELRGDVPNVVFSCANPVVNDTIHVFYGGGDHVIGLATCHLAELLDFTLHG